MSGTERPTDREEDYRFLHSMLMEKKLHLLFKVKISSFASALSHQNEPVWETATLSPAQAGMDRSYRLCERVLAVPTRCRQS